jgi:hypothetical protein
MPFCVSRNTGAPLAAVLLTMGGGMAHQEANKA